MADRKRIVLISVAGGAILAFGIAGFFAQSALSNGSDIVASSGPLAQEEIVIPSMEPAPCDFAQWNGLSRDDVEQRAQETGRPNRILRPGQPMTMDYRPDRINVELDDNDIVVRVFCG